MTVTVRQVRCVDELDTCLAIREAVFIQEQRVTPELERDGLDGACRHYLAKRAGTPVGTARVRRIGRAAKIQRVAVLATERGRGIGFALMQAILSDLETDRETDEAVLDSQLSAIGFYVALGFMAEGPEFMDAGIAHRHMRRRLG